MSRRTIVTLVLLVALVAPSCASSGSGDGSADDGSGATDTTVAVSGPPAALAGSCPTQQDLDAAQDRLEAASGEAGSVDEIVAEYDASFSFLAAYLPEERQADLDVVRAAFRGYLGALDGIDLTDPDQLSADQLAALNQASQAFEAPEVEEANRRIEQYFADACPDVDFTEGDSVTSSTPS